jgi:hypothetical protein
VCCTGDVIHATGSTATEVENRQQQWKQSLAQHAKGREMRLSNWPHEFLYAVDVVALVEPNPNPDVNQLQRLAAALAEFGAWSAKERSFTDETLQVEEWLANWETVDDPILHINTAPEPTLHAFERDFLERNGTTVYDLSNSSRVLQFLKVSGEVVCFGDSNSLQAARIYGLRSADGCCRHVA